MSRPCLGREVNLAPTGWVHRCAVGAIFRSRPCSRLPQEALLLCRSDLQIATCLSRDHFLFQGGNNEKARICRASQRALLAR
jgi:hypothetical protein